MPCQQLGDVIACGPPRGVYHRTIRHCPVCKRRRRALVRWDGAWYGTTDYCACGDHWQDGQLGYRPSEKGWRKKAQAEFRAMWDNAAPRPLYDAYVDADIRFAVADGDQWEHACDDRDAALTAIHARTSTEGT